MSQTDLFGNIIPSASTSKSFKLVISSSAPSKHKKVKTEINKCIEQIDDIKKEINQKTEALNTTKHIYHKLTESIQTILESKWLSYFQLLTNYIEDKKSESWEKEFIYHLINKETLVYKHFHLDEKAVQHIEHFINTYKTDQQENIDQEILETEFTFEMNNDIPKAHETLEVKPYSNSKFKTLYKTLLKQVHPDVLWATSKESEIRIQELNKLWEDQDFYQLLIFNHEINPNSNFELNMDDLNEIHRQSKEKLTALEIELETLITCSDYIFYVKQFYNISEFITTSNIQAFVNTLIQKVDDLNTILGQCSNTLQLSYYLKNNRIQLSEELDIKYLIEDLYHSENE